jgi:glucose-1-phosphate thymidylyltransferase
MKALLLAGGRGTRLLPLSNTTAKHLIPVANKPIIFYALDQIERVGIKEVGIIVSPETGTSIKKEVGDGSRWNAEITYILQSKPMGIAHAVSLSKNYIGDSPFLTYLGDNIIQEDIGWLISDFKAHNPDALILLKEVDNPSAFGVAVVDSYGRIKYVVEKPERYLSNMALVGIYVFNIEIFQAIDRIKPSRRGELEITDAIQELLTMNKAVRSNILTGWWLDTGTKESVLEANNAVLSCFTKKDFRGSVDSKSSIIGLVAIRPESKIDCSRIEGPTIIAKDCRISNSDIGPYTSVGSGTVIDRSCVSNSILMEDCTISMVQELKGSIIGKRSKVLGDNDGLAYINLCIGDNSVFKP